MPNITIAGVLGVLIFIAVLVAFVPTVAELNDKARYNYLCQDPVYTEQSTDGKLCTNQTFSCKAAAYPVYNWTSGDCQNSTGAHIAGTSGFSQYNESATNVGVSVPEYALLGMVVLFVIIALVVGLIHNVKLNK